MQVSVVLAESVEELSTARVTVSARTAARLVRGASGTSSVYACSGAIGVERLVAEKTHARSIVGRLVWTPADVVRRIAELLCRASMFTDDLLFWRDAVPGLGEPAFKPPE